MKKWETLSTDYLYKTRFGNLRKDKCKLPNGIIIEDFYVNEYSDWVNAVVITNQNQIVLVEQYRHGGQNFYLEVPAGKIEENETYEESILREIQEETGYTSLEKPILLGEYMVNPATQDNKVKTFLITEAFKATNQQLDNTEDINVKLFDFEELGNLIKDKVVETQLFTASAYFMAKSALNNRNY
ncbi:ADP-ribose pyrophosphatase [Planococcus kocurii]|uniref:ADP-ribose pyrophosphatase n=1 Tax=Planococcus kocurii TaxID=1374 RepID=A0ABM5WVT7_9BACL|nr:NUDIX hydrolase [Planococcus kocurii]ALS78465.1 ADP-ribose pyrophosphatase [Planococcus kocurii]